MQNKDRTVTELGLHHYASNKIVQRDGPNTYPSGTKFHSPKGFSHFTIKSEVPRKRNRIFVLYLIYVLRIMIIFDDSFHFIEQSFTGFPSLFELKERPTLRYT